MPQQRPDIKTGHRGLFVLLSLFIGVMNLPQLWADRPNASQRIAAILVSWGFPLEHSQRPVDKQSVDRRLEMLRTGRGEQRIEAARWLASHGVREAAGPIAQAMDDPLTTRPCQLAHSLGRLGDVRWTDQLVRAANQSQNRDLQICATIGLKKLASQRAVEALIDLAENGTARTTAIEALGVIGDSRATPHLREIINTSTDRFERRAARQALQRIEILNRDDPVPALLEQLEVSIDDGHINKWALRWLATKADNRAVPRLVFYLHRSTLSTDQQQYLAAALLAHDKPGVDALQRIANADSPGRDIAQSALSLLTTEDFRLASKRASAANES